MVSTCFPQFARLIGLRRCAFWLLSVFKPQLAAKTVWSPRHGFEPPQVNLISAFDTHTESTPLYSGQCRLDHAEQTTAFICMLKQRFLGNARDTTIRDILWIIRIHGACLIG